jgi:CBS domain-containing protein
MAIFPGAKSGDILAWRGIAEVIGEIRRSKADRVSGLLTEESIDLLNGLKGRLEEELAFEERFSAQFSQAQNEIEDARIEDDFTTLMFRFNRLIEEYYRKRGSVVALHTLFAVCRNGLVRKGLQRVEEWLEMEGAGRPPVRYCLLGGGSIGRQEQTFCIDPAYLLIHDDTTADGAGYFEKFTFRTVAFLESIGLLNSVGATAALKTFRHVSRMEWRREITGELSPDDREKLSELVRRADLGLISGDAALAEEMINVVWSMLEFRQGELREAAKGAATASQIRAALSFPLPGLRDMGKGIAEMPSGLDFFNRLRVEKGGRHRGEFDLEQYALAPLVANVRILTVSGGLHETGTIGRIKGLQERGQLSVELTERLLRAYHDFTRLKLNRQLARGCEQDLSRFVAPQELTPDEEHRLRTGLEAVAGLEKIAYLLFTEQG